METSPACSSAERTTYLGLMKNLYWMSTVMRKKTTPSTAMAKRFLPTRSHDRGDTKRSSPAKMRLKAQSLFQSKGSGLAFLPAKLTKLGTGTTGDQPVAGGKSWTTQGASCSYMHISYCSKAGTQAQRHQSAKELAHLSKRLVKHKKTMTQTWHLHARKNNYPAF